MLWCVVTFIHAPSAHPALFATRAAKAPKSVGYMSELVFLPSWEKSSKEAPWEHPERVKLINVWDSPLSVYLSWPALASQQVKHSEQNCWWHITVKLTADFSALMQAGSKHVLNKIMALISLSVVWHKDFNIFICNKFLIVATIRQN